LDAIEFMRRYEQYPEDRVFELIEGVVFMQPPLSAEFHGEPDASLSTILGVYAAHTPGVRHFTNSTLRLDFDNTVQPDSILCTEPRAGGAVALDKKGYLVGAPELVAEVAATTVALDLRDKLQIYRRNGVGEYLVWCTRENDFHWYVREGGQFVRQTPTRGGLLRSAQFPGLVLDVPALLARKGAKVLSTLRGAIRSAKHREFVKKLRAKS
jgi:Uma2 family endonuclease